MALLSPILFEQLAPRHEGGLAELFISLSINGDEVFFYPHPLTASEARRLCYDTGLDQYFVATIKGRVIGYGMLRGWNEGYSFPSLGIATHPEHRNLRVLSFLISCCIEQARSSHATCLRLTVAEDRTSFIKFLERYGCTFQADRPGRLVGMLELQPLENP